MVHLPPIKQICKYFHLNLSESCLRDLFSAVNGNYSIPSQSGFRIPGVNTVFYMKNSIMYFGSMIWNTLPTDLRKNFDFNLFKTTIQKWKPVDYPIIRPCKTYITGFGFINVSSYLYQAVYAKFSWFFFVIFLF